MKKVNAVKSALPNMTKINSFLQISHTVDIQWNIKNKRNYLAKLNGDSMETSIWTTKCHIKPPTNCRKLQGRAQANSLRPEWLLTRKNYMTVDHQLQPNNYFIAHTAMYLIQMEIGLFYSCTYFSSQTNFIYIHISHYKANLISHYLFKFHIQ